MKRNIKKISIIILAIISAAIVIFFTYKNLSEKLDDQLISSAEEAVAQESGATASEPNNTANEEAPQSGVAEVLKITDNDIVLGDKNAPITFIEYASLSCPHCAIFYSDAFPKLKTDYIDSGKIKFVYRDFPLNQPALAAGVLALCQVKDANRDAEKYYNFIKVLLRTQESWAFVQDFSEKLKTIAKLDGISNDKFASCMENKDLQERILKNRLQAAQVLQISSTPTFFVNGEVVNGYNGYSDLKNVIEAKLSSLK